MSIRGGRASRRLCVAGALALLLLPLVPMAAEAQSVADPWWGPAERSSPTQGWAVRVPVVVTNRYDFPLTDTFVAADLDLSKLLVEAGWTNITSGGVPSSRGFTLDIDSIRVVPYTNGFTNGPLDGPTTNPIPHRFYNATFEGKFKVYDPRAATGTVLFQIPGDIPPQGQRSFYIYASPQEYGDMAPASFKPIDMSPLDAYMWGTRGNVYLGYEPQQEGQTTHPLRILPLTGPTTVTVSTYENGRFVPLPTTSTQANPQQVSFPKTLIVPAGKAFKVEADRPIVLAGQGGATDGTAIRERFGYVPGRSGSFADDVFDVFGWGADGSTGTTLRLVKADEPGTVTVRAGAQTTTLSSATPTGTISIPPGQWTMVTGSGGKFLISLQILTQNAAQPNVPQQTIQLPATSGGPVGLDFYNQVVTDKGFIRVCAEDNATIRLVQVFNQAQIRPEGSAGSTPPGFFEKKTFCEDVEVPRNALMGLYEFYSVKDDNLPVPNAPVPFRAMVGAGLRAQGADGTNATRGMVGHYGGPGGVDYYTFGGTGLFGHYNDTKVTVREERVKNGVTSIATYSVSLHRDSFATILKHAEGTGRFHITANKPFAAVSLDDTLYRETDLNGNTVTQSAPYVRHVVGRPMAANVTVGKLEFRGPLVDLVSSKVAARQDTVTTGPGTPLEYRIDVRNLGRWLGNAPLEDVVTVTCTTPTGWTVEGCAREIPLSGASSERLNVVVTPTAEDVGNTLPIVVEARSKAGGPVATFTLRVHVEVRYGVAMWFDVEGGRKTMDPPVGLSPGETYRGTIVIKNTGSTQDRFTLKLEAPAAGWTHALLHQEEPVESILLDGGESALLTYRSTAPNAEQGPQNLVSLTAQSTASALAADIVYPGTRIRPKIDLEMVLSPQTQIAAPNETVAFNITTRNKGNDVFTVLFAQDSVLPVGWTAELATPEVSLNPNDTFVSQLRVTPSAGARAGDLASLKLSAEVDTGAGRAAGDEVSAVVVVRRVYNLTTPPLFDSEARPGDAIVVQLPVVNSGNGQVEIEMLSGAVDAALLRPDGDVIPVPDWDVELQAEEVTLALNESTDLQLRIVVPELTPPGLYNITFTTRLSREAVQNLTVPVQVAPVTRVALDGAASLDMVPGRTQRLAYVVRNTGNVEATFELGATTPSGWNATFSPASVVLAPGERTDVQLLLNATRDTTNGAYDAVLRATANGASAGETPLRAEVARPQLYLADVAATGAMQPGELVLVTATVGNRGGITADNVSVALVVDEVVVDRVTLSRIPVSGTAVATLSWVSTQRGGDVRVVLDPEQEIELQSRGEDTAKGVEFGSRLGTPGFGAASLVLALGVACAVGLLRRRRA